MTIVHSDVFYHHGHGWNVVEGMQRLCSGGTVKEKDVFLEVGDVL